MVATRGGARTGLDDPVGSELNLRKKPVRKAATTTRTKTTKKAPPAKTIRAKKVEPESDIGDQEVDELQENEAVVPPTVTCKGRARKEDVSSTSKPTAASRARATAATTAKPATTRKAKASKVETTAPDLKPPSEARATRATRATASTRATAAKEKAAPLSPKKITQMPKAPARNTRNATTKATGYQGASAKEKPVTRRRGVSDENAGVPELRPSSAEQPGDEVKSKQNTKNKSVDSMSTAQPKRETIQSDGETSMSTRPTAPADSPKLDHELAEEDTDVEDVEIDLSVDAEVSADELCGPRTPMKRLSPRERAQYLSAQKPSLAEAVPMKTPARRFKALGSQGGTPQAQKPYRRPNLPTSEVRPMTVARASGRAMVFPKLQPLASTREAEEFKRSVCDKTAHMSEDEEASVMEMEQLDISASLISESADVDRDNTPVHTTGPAIEDNSPVNSDKVEDLIINVGSQSAADAYAEDREIIEIPFQMKLITHDNSEKQADAEVAEKLDPRETILMEDEDMEHGLDSQVNNSLVSEESVIVCRDIAIEADHSFNGDDSAENSILPATIPRPETIKWENLREDVTIPFNFDSGRIATRESALEELHEPLGLAHDDVGEALSENGNDAVDETDMLDIQMNTDVGTNMTLAKPQYQRQSFGDFRLSLDATVHLSDFLEVSSLTERPGASHQDSMKDDELSVGIVASEHQADVEVEDVGEAEKPGASPVLRSAAPVEMLSMPTRESVPSLPDGPQKEPEHTLEAHIPHYAMPTIAFRRKSLPALIYHTPIKNGARPKTSDGATMPRLANPFFSMDESQEETTRFRRRLSMAQAGRSSRPQTPALGTPARLSSRKTPRTSGKVNVRQTPQLSQASRASSRISVRPTPEERFPGLPPRETYVELVNTPTFKTSRQSVSSAVNSAVNERSSTLPPAEKVRVFAETPRSSRTPLLKVATPQTAHPSAPTADTLNMPVQQEERYPGLPHRRTYEEHANTAMPPSRFRTPSQSPAKRPATVQRPATLRRMALRASPPNGFPTSVKTPLRAASMTPGQVPLTPHPGAPFKGVTAYVDVFLNDGSSANSTYITVLHSLGAKTTKTFNERVTHVVYKEGSPATLQRLRLHNKQVADSGKGTSIFCVNGRWVNDSNSEGVRMDENDEAYAVDTEDQRATKRRRKSMEPTSLLNIGGNVVRDTNRKGSLGRGSLGRALRAISPSSESPTMKMSIDIAEKENSGDSSFNGDESPATPAYLAAPDSLIQQTAPMNRVKKLDFDTQEQAKNRRLTFWDGGEF